MIKKLMKSHLMLFLMICFHSVIFSQEWRKCAFDETGFSVELPVSCPSVSYEGSDGRKSVRDSTTDEGVSIYLAPQTGKYSRQFEIIVSDAPQTLFNGATRVDAIKGVYWEIGGDDSSPSTVRSFRSNGFSGNEYIYENGGPKGLYSRGRVIDSGDQIFVLSFRSTLKGDITSKDVERFFNSFQVLVRTPVLKK